MAVGKNEIGAASMMLARQINPSWHGKTFKVLRKQTDEVRPCPPE
jgi:hypothetical protein